MKWSSIFAFLLLFALLGQAKGEYWFQSGVRAGNSAANNNGASVTIQTVYQTPKIGSFAFWVGEDLSNGAFLQVGYTIENQTGYYPNNCTPSGCSSTVYLTAGTPTWFYEYFLPGENTTFLGALGPNGSAGANGTFHTYSFYALGNTWYVLFDGKQIGEVNLGTSSSGPNPPAAIAELANSTGYASYMNPVIFENLSAYLYTGFYPVESGYGVVSYGLGSKTNIPNPYGVKEIDDRVNYFEVGSGLPTSTNGTLLWKLGYFLNITAPFKNLSSSTEYKAYAKVPISAPSTIIINKTAKAVFEGWIGRGIGSYTGPSNATYVNMYSNIQEYAEYKIYYFVNISSNFPTFGTGWYANGSLASYGVNKTVIYSNSSTRYVFSRWSNGTTSPVGSFIVTKPVSLFAYYAKQYFVNVSSQYGNVTGAGWINQSSIDVIKVEEPIINISPTSRYAFIEWSNGSKQESISIKVNKPVSLKAMFAKEYLVTLFGENAYGEPINVEKYKVNGEEINQSAFLPVGSYAVSSAYYKGVWLNTSHSFYVSKAENITLSLPVYNVQISTEDLLGLPVNASATITFANGTTIQTHINGQISFANVPYGLAKVVINSLIPVSSTAYGGTPMRITVISPEFLGGAVVVVALLAFALWYIYERKKLAETGK